MDEIEAGRFRFAAKGVLTKGILFLPVAAYFFIDPCGQTKLAEKFTFQFRDRHAFANVERYFAVKDS